MLEFEIVGNGWHRVEAVLIDRLKKLGIAVQWNSCLDAFTQNADYVEAKVICCGKESSVRTRYLLGADGARSDVRKVLNVPFEGEVYPENFLLLDVDMDSGLEDDGMYMCLMQTGSIWMFPFPEKGKWRISLTFGGEQIARSQEEILRFVESNVFKATNQRVQLGNPGWITDYKISKKIVPSYGSGRVYLMGDACHVHSPAGGQGMNLAIQDAFNVCWKLALVLRYKAGALLLDSYEKERRPIAAAILKGSDRATKLFTIAGKVLVPIRNFFIRLVFSIEALKRRVVNNRIMPNITQLGHNYVGSSTVLDVRSGLPKKGFGSRQSIVVAGMRFPDLRLSEGWVHSLVSNSTFTFILCNSSDANLIVKLKRVYEFVVLCLDNSIVKSGKLSNGPCVYLIRPDRMVAYVSDDLDFESLVQYLGTIGIKRFVE